MPRSSRPARRRPARTRRRGPGRGWSRRRPRRSEALRRASASARGRPDRPRARHAARPHPSTGPARSTRARRDRSVQVRVLACGLVLDEAVVHDVLRTALRSGGRFAEVFAEERRSTSIRLDDRRIEELTEGTDRGARIRVIPRETASYAYPNRLEPGGPPEGAQGQAEEAARTFSGEVRQVVVGYGDSVQRLLVANSTGTWTEEERHRVRLIAQVVASRDGVVQTGFEGPAALGGAEVLDAYPPGETGAGPARRTAGVRGGHRRGRRLGPRSVGIVRGRRRGNRSGADRAVRGRRARGDAIRPLLGGEERRLAHVERKAAVLCPPSDPADDQHLDPAGVLEPGRDRGGYKAGAIREAPRRRTGQPGHRRLRVRRVRGVPHRERRHHHAGTRRQPDRQRDRHPGGGGLGGGRLRCPAGDLRQGRPGRAGDDRQPHPAGRPDDRGRDRWLTSVTSVAPLWPASGTARRARRTRWRASGRR